MPIPETSEMGEAEKRLREELAVRDATVAPADGLLFEDIRALLAELTTLRNAAREADEKRVEAERERSLAQGNFIAATRQRDEANVYGDEEHARADAAEARLARAVEVLEPFAGAADVLAVGRHDAGIIPEYAAAHILVRDLRAARDFLSASSPPDDPVAQIAAWADRCVGLAHGAAIRRGDWRPPSTPVGNEAWKPTHRHYKGGMYRVLQRDLVNRLGFDLGAGGEISTVDHGAVLITDRWAAGVPAVVYENAKGERFLRPQAMFDEPGRFEPVGNEVQASDRREG